jgi:hypothetical protein
MIAPMTNLDELYSYRFFDQPNAKRFRLKHKISLLIQPVVYPATWLEAKLEIPERTCNQDSRFGEEDPAWR